MNIIVKISTQIRRLFLPAVFSLLLILPSGCVEEHITGGEFPGGEVRFTLTMPRTRLLSPADENEVGRIDVLVFAGDGGKYHGRKTRTGAQIMADDSDIRKKSFTVSLPHGRFDLMILANAEDELNTVSLNGTTKAEAREIIQAALGTSGKWIADPADAGYRPIPMWGDVGTVAIDQTANPAWANSVTMIRMLARADVQVGVSDFKLESVRLYNYNTRGHLVPDAIAWIGGDKVTVPTVPSSSVVTLGPAVYEGTQITSNACDGEIYLFEAENLNRSSKLSKGREDRTCLVVGGKWDELHGGSDYSDDPVTYYRVDFSTGEGSTEKFLDVLRNHHYTFDITSVSAKGYDDPDDAFRGTSRLTAKITAWNLAQQSASDGQYYLKVNNDKYLFKAQESMQTLNAETDYILDTEGFPAGIYYTVQYEGQSQPGWLNISNHSGGDGSQARSWEITALENTNPTSARSARMKITAGNITKIIHITQAPQITGGGTPPSGSGFTYVGAFWRANQTGERLIRIANLPAGAAGEWTAQVLEYGDFQPGDIVFSTDPSSDPNIDTDNAADMYTHDATYQVTGNRQWVSGTAATGGEISFRIGLKSKWSNDPAYNATTKPARYAVVAISYNNNTKFQKLYLRQGHEADYVMRPEDLSTYNSYFARKFTPYNLTHPDLKSGNNTGGLNISNHPTIPPRNTIPVGIHEDYFTKYPSQAGAFFQWADNVFSRKAFHPINTTKIGGWQENRADGYWNTVEGINETCPPGYRRPHDGPTNGDNSGNPGGSEMRQSLWHYPQSSTTSNVSNSVWGYYADGFFDRRKITTPPGGYSANANSAVSVTTGAIAYGGRLFFHLTTNASLFLPAAGRRFQNDNGRLEETGGGGNYWSTSLIYSTTGASYLEFGTLSAGMKNSNTSFGYSIRCVRAE